MMHFLVFDTVMEESSVFISILEPSLFAFLFSKTLFLKNAFSSFIFMSFSLSKSGLTFTDSSSNSRRSWVILSFVLDVELLFHLANSLWQSDTGPISPDFLQLYACSSLSEERYSLDWKPISYQNKNVHLILTYHLTVLWELAYGLILVTPSILWGILKII